MLGVAFQNIWKCVSGDYWCQPFGHMIFCDKCTRADLGFSVVVSLGETPFSSIEESDYSALAHTGTLYEELLRQALKTPLKTGYSNTTGTSLHFMNNALCPLFTVQRIVRARDDREWLFTFPFPLIPTWSIAIHSFPFPNNRSFVAA